MADAPKRIQLSRRKGYRKPEGAVVVARPSRWGNPYRVAEHGQAGAVDKHRAWVKALNFQDVCFMLPDRFATLQGRDLACWCKLCPEHVDGKPLGVECAECAPCHADVLLSVANQREVANG